MIYMYTGTYDYDVEGFGQRMHWMSWMYKKTCTVTRNTPLCYTFKTLYRYQGKL